MTPQRQRHPFTNLVGKEVFCGYVMVVTYKDKRPTFRKKFTGYLHMTDSRLNDVLRKIDGFNPEEIQSVTLTVRVDNPQRPIDQILQRDGTRKDLNDGKEFN